MIWGTPMFEHSKILKNIEFIEYWKLRESKLTHASSRCMLRIFFESCLDFHDRSWVLPKTFPLVQAFNVSPVAPVLLCRSEPAKSTMFIFPTRTWSWPSNPHSMSESMWRSMGIDCWLISIGLVAGSKGKPVGNKYYFHWIPVDFRVNVLKSSQWITCLSLPVLFPESPLWP